MQVGYNNVLSLCVGQVNIQIIAQYIKNNAYENVDSIVL